MRWLFDVLPANFRRRLASFVAAAALLVATPASGVEAQHAPSINGVGYQWWSHAKRASQLSAVAASIDAIRVGWVWGVDALENSADKTVANPDAVNAIAWAAARSNPPTFSKTVVAYRGLIDDMYSKKAAVRRSDVSIILLCLADTPVLECPR